MPARNNAPITQKQIDRYKQRAKTLKKESGISHAEALDTVAREEGFSNWKGLIGEAALDENQDEEDPDQFELLPENIDATAEALLTANNQILTKLGIEHSIFIPTPTGLKKSILDATGTIRTLFELSNFHFYDLQGKGTEHRIRKTAFFLLPDSIAQTQVSLYRPNTKNGDPRMWFSQLPAYANAWDKIATIIFNDVIYLINLTQFDLADSEVKNDLIWQFFNEYRKTNNEISTELLLKLRELAKKPITALGKGDTAIGMAIEAALGITANSSKAPDYKGIEIKTGRGNKTRTTLFAQVPIWTISACKSSGEILDGYGYARGERKKLYCTVSTLKANSQGLYFECDLNKDVLQELHVNKNSVAIWTGSLLRDRLKEKHSETFWINADSETINGIEHFHLKSIEHTKSPLLAQLMPLIDAGIVTMDHLISRDLNRETGAREKGPLFKIKKQNLSLLFPEPQRYTLG